MSVFCFLLGGIHHILLLDVLLDLQLLPALQGTACRFRAATGPKDQEPAPGWRRGRKCSQWLEKKYRMTEAAYRRQRSTGRRPNLMAGKRKSARTHA